MPWLGKEMAIQPKMNTNLAVLGKLIHILHCRATYNLQIGCHGASKVSGKVPACVFLGALLNFLK